MRARSHREEVRIAVRFVCDEGWADAEIRNVSDRGLMAHSPSPPCKGAYIEIRRDTYSIVGRVVWSSGACFGLRAQDDIVLADLAAARQRVEAKKVEERRSKAREAAPKLPDDSRAAALIAEASARFSRKFQFVAVGLVAASLACSMAQQASLALGTPIATIQEALFSAGHR